MSSKKDLRRLDARIAYPWNIEAEMPEDVTGMGTDEQIYGDLDSSTEED